MRQGKELLLNEIREKIDASKAMIITRYDKLTPNASWQLRHQIAQSGGSFEVVRKKIFLKAAEKSGIQLDPALLKGHVGIAFICHSDAIPSAKLIFKFSADNGEIFHVLCGQIEGKLVPGAELEMLSKLPGIDEMRSSLLALFTSPMSQLLAVLEAVMAEPLSVIEQKSE